MLRRRNEPPAPPQPTYDYESNTYLMPPTPVPISPEQDSRGMSSAPRASVSSLVSSGSSQPQSSLSGPPSNTVRQQRAHMLQLLRTEAEASAASPTFSYAATGPVSWKSLWNALLSGQQASLRAWVAALPLKGCKVDSAGRLEVDGSVIPPTFALQLNEMLDKAVPPLADLVIDALCWRGVFLPSELANYDLLSVRLARNLLLLRPAGKRENKPLSLEKFLPFASLSPFHRYMLTHRLKRNVYQHQTLRKTYITWYKLKDFMAEIDQESDKLERLERRRRNGGRGAVNGLGHGHRSEGGGGDGGNGLPNGGTADEEDESYGKVPPALCDLSGKGKIDEFLGTFVPGLGYIIGVGPDGMPIFGTEDESIDAIRAAQAVADGELSVLVAAEIDQVQQVAADGLTRPNFEIDWLKLLGIPALKVQPLHIHHNQVSEKLHREIELMLPAPGRGVSLLRNDPHDQILMLILFLIYRNSSVRAMRISMPLLQSNPTVMYRYLSTLVSKVAISCCAIKSLSNKRNQANCLHYLKMLQHYCDAMPGSAPDGTSTVHGLPCTTNYALYVSLMLDFTGVLQRHLSMSEIFNTGALSSLLPHEHIAPFERLHLPSLMWMVFDALIRRRNSRLESLAERAPEADDTERLRDAQMIQWFLALGMRLYKITAAASRANISVGHGEVSDSTTVLYLMLGFHMLLFEAFPSGFGDLLKAEQCDAGPIALFAQVFLWFGGLAQESPMYLMRRLMQLHDEHFFDDPIEGYMTSATDGRDPDATTREQRPLNGMTCLEHLCLVLAPHSAILLAAKIPERGETLTTQQLADQAAACRPVWDPTSEALLRIAFDPMTQHVLNLSTPAKAAYLLGKSEGDEALLSLACGIGASPADCLLTWLKRNQPELLAGVPDLPPPGPRAPGFMERSQPLEKCLLRLTRAGCWYTLLHGFRLFAPNNILYSVLSFLKAFTQRRYALCHKALEESFDLLAATRDLRQPAFGKRHFFAVVAQSGSAGTDAHERNGQCFMWTQRMLSQLIRAGLLIGMQGNIPSSHRIVNAKDNRIAGATATNAAGYTAIDLTDYDRNFLMDLFGGQLTRHTPSDVDVLAGHTGVFTMQQMTEILSIIPPTVSSSFLLNITSIQNGLATTITHRHKHTQHRYDMWKARLIEWRDQESYFVRKVAEVVQLLDLEALVGMSLDERQRFIRHLYREMEDLEVTPTIRAALWYQVCIHLYRTPHSAPDSLLPKSSNSSAAAASVGSGGPLATGNPSVVHSAAAISNAKRAGAPVGSAASQDPELLGGTSFEHRNERAECIQEIVLLYLALQNWAGCFEQVNEELEQYFRSNPNGRPTPKVLSTSPEGHRTFSKTETQPATDSNGKPIPLPAEIVSLLAQQAQYRFVVSRVRGRVYWLMLLHGMDTRDTKTSQIEYDLNEISEVAEWHARRKERDAARTEKQAERVIARATHEAAVIVAKATGTYNETEMPSLSTSEPDQADDDLDEEQEDDELFPPLLIDFVEIQRAHVGTGAAGAGGTISGISFGLEKFHVLSPLQYLPWNGSPLQNPSSAVADAQAKHRAVSFAFDEDMDITRLSPTEVRLLGEHSIDTKFVLALVESLIHTSRFRSALCVVADVLDRFPALRFTPRMQAAIALCDLVQLLFWLAHPTLQDVRVNHVLSGQAGLPFASMQKRLILGEERDPYARAYKELLAWPVLPHMLREEDQTWSRMRWSSSGGISNQTLMLQRLMVDSPTGTVYQNLLLSLFLRPDEQAGFGTVYSRTRPVGVDVKSSDPSVTSPSSGGGGFFSGTLNFLSQAVKGAPASGPSNDTPTGLDVEHMRQWILTLDEAARVELLDRFVQMANNPMAAPVTSSPGTPAGLSAMAGVVSSGPHSLLKESFNASFTTACLRHLPLLCEVAQFLALSVRVTSVELTPKRNKKLAIADVPGVRMTATNFLTALATILVKTRAVSTRLPATIPLHYASRARLPPDTNSPTHAWMLNLAENLGMPLMHLLALHPATLVCALWNSPGGVERGSIGTLLQSDQIYRHFMNHPEFTSLDREVTSVDLSGALVEAYLTELKLTDAAAGPPSPWPVFQQGGWWSREELVAFVGLADRTASLALPTLAAAFRAQAFVIIRARDPAAAVSSSLLASTDTAAGLLGWWTNSASARTPERPYGSHGEFVRLQPGTMIEFELLHASYLCYLCAGRTLEMRQVASDIRSGLQALLLSVQTKSKTPAPPLITSPTNPNESIAPPFPGSSLEQHEHIFLARLQLERVADFLNNAEMTHPIINLWRKFKLKAPTTFA